METQVGQWNAPGPDRARRSHTDSHDTNKDSNKISASNEFTGRVNSFGTTERKNTRHNRGTR